MMRTEKQTRKQLSQVLYRHLQRRLRSNFKHRPHTCSHNRTSPVGKFEVGVCGHPRAQDREEIPVAPFLCDSRCPVEVHQAKECPWWEPLATKKTVKDEFQALIESGDRGHIAAEYPDVAALMWVLDAQETNLLDILSDGDDT